jgi:hypothetical protein
MNSGTSTAATPFRMGSSVRMYIGIGRPLWWQEALANKAESFGEPQLIRVY